MTTGDGRLTAPESVAFCLRCGGPMQTEDFRGTPRRRCTACRYIHFVEPKVGVGVMVVENRRLLLVKRGAEPQRGKWSLPAGYLDYGEEPRAAAERETLEETGLRVRAGALLDAFHNPPSSAGATLFLLYEATRTGGELCAADDAEAAAFMAPDEVGEVAFPSTWAALRRLAAGTGDPER